jgi:hypothetical protein
MSALSDFLPIATGLSPLLCFRFPPAAATCPSPQPAAESDMAGGDVSSLKVWRRAAAGVLLFIHVGVVGRALLFALALICAQRQLVTP